MGIPLTIEPYPFLHVVTMRSLFKSNIWKIFNSFFVFPQASRPLSVLAFCAKLQLKSPRRKILDDFVHAFSRGSYILSKKSYLSGGL
jgi:hypothetical protein